MKSGGGSQGCESGSKQKPELMSGSGGDFVAGVVPVSGLLRALCRFCTVKIAEERNACYAYSGFALKFG